MYKKLKDFQKSGIWRGVDGFNSILVSVAGVCLTAMIFATVVARYVFKRDIFGSEEIIMFFAWWLYFIGGIGGSQEDSHIKADMIEVFCSNKFIVDFCRGLAKALESFVFFLAAYMTYLMLQTNFKRWPVTTALKIPYVATQIPIFIGFIGMAVFAIYWSLFFFARAFEYKKGGVVE